MKNPGSAKVSHILIVLNTVKGMSRKIISLPVQGFLCYHVLLHKYLNSSFNLPKDFFQHKMTAQRAI